MDPHVQLIRHIFHECDVDFDGYLRMEELRYFATETGFDDTSAAWAEEYAAICGARGVDPAKGFREAAFAAFVEDDSESGCNCSDEELRGVLARLQATRSWRQGAGSSPARDSGGTSCAASSSASASVGARLVASASAGTLASACASDCARAGAGAGASGTHAIAVGAVAVPAAAAAKGADASTCLADVASDADAAAASTCLADVASDADAAAGSAAGAAGSVGSSAFAAGADAAAGGAAAAACLEETAAEDAGGVAAAASLEETAAEEMCGHEDAYTEAVEIGDIAEMEAPGLRGGAALDEEAQADTLEDAASGTGDAGPSVGGLLGEETPALEAEALTSGSGSGAPWRPDGATFMGGEEWAASCDAAVEGPRGQLCSAPEGPAEAWAERECRRAALLAACAVLGEDFSSTDVGADLATPDCEAIADEDHTAPLPLVADCGPGAGVGSSSSSQDCVVAQPLLADARPEASTCSRVGEDDHADSLLSRLLMEVSVEVAAEQQPSASSCEDPVAPNSFTDSLGKGTDAASFKSRATTEDLLLHSLGAGGAVGVGRAVNMGTAKDRSTAHTVGCNSLVRGSADGGASRSPLPRFSFNWLCRLDHLEKQLAVRLDLCLRTRHHEATCGVLLERLEALFREHMPGGPGWRLLPFGSAASGFGTPDCDLDVTAVGPEACGRSGPEGTQADLSRLATILRASQFRVEDTVLHARVPLLRLRHRGQEVDLSLNNTKALQNTRLLKAYGRLDSGVIELGVAVKLWAKDQVLCGASSGHLSSYALTLMAIYFLQVARKMPLLQAPGDEALTFEDADAWEGRAKEAAAGGWRLGESAASLFDSFVAFYATEFRWGTEVVSVRLGRRLQRDAPDFEQLRGRKIVRLQIEDPLEPSRNLQDVLRPENEWRVFLALRAEYVALRGFPSPDALGAARVVAQPQPWMPQQAPMLGGGIPLPQPWLPPQLQPQQLAFFMQNRVALSTIPAVGAVPVGGQGSPHRQRRPPPERRKARAHSLV